MSHGNSRDSLDRLVESLDEPARGHARKSLELAAKVYGGARRHRTKHERALDAERAGMVRDARGKETMTLMMDQAFRSKEAGTTAEQMALILKEHGVPRFFSWYERLGLWLFQLLAAWFPGILVPIVKAVMRKKTEEVILPGEFRKMVGHVRDRGKNGVRLTLNHLGEMILGEGEAGNKTEDDVALLECPDIDCISVKASNLYSQVSSLAFDRSVRMMIERIRPRLRAAKENRRQSYDAAKAESWDRGYKLVNLDMEEYRDMAITVEAFRRVLDEEEFLDLQAGIAIQAYIPDSYGVVEGLLCWARDRVARGGAPIRIRVVKGANRAVELVDSSLRGIECPTYDDKIDTDANWKAIVELISRPENISVCHIGVATHNIFDLCWAALLIKERGAEGRCLYEMLEGMVNHVHREVQREVGDVLLYAPSVPAEKFLTAIAYLVRRFDEMTDPNNFLSHIFGITPGTPEWDKLAEIFIKSIRRMPSVSHACHRSQDRRQAVYEPRPLGSLKGFRNEPDTDWTGEGNRAWLKNEVIGGMERASRSGPALIPLVSTACVEPGTRPSAEVIDRSRPELVAARIELASVEDAMAALDASVAATRWSEMDEAECGAILAAAVAEFQRRRGEFIAVSAINVGKSFDQTDGEVSEAIDFGVLYPFAARYFKKALPNVGTRPLGSGVIVVISPWNFPIAIPAGGVFAALSAGNRVILKPSSGSRLATTKIAECFWAAGVPRDALQVVNCESRVAAELIRDPRVAGVILTGGTDTADRIMRSRPDLQLCAETGGKNATIITGKADREMAIKHVVASYRNDGQKCSATSLILLTPEVYGDEEFWSQLKDAVQSLPVGSAWDPSSVVTPLHARPGEDLARGLTRLEEGEEWVVQPRMVGGRDDFWSPGLKRGTRRGGFDHLTELFGPVITAMRVTDLAEALAVVKETGRGLTLGIESLDDREIRYVVDNAEAGVIYCNKATVGAIVQRQTFGGWRDSRRGPGIHAGGVNYVTSFRSYKEADGAQGDPVIRNFTADELAAMPNAGTCQAVAVLASSLMLAIAHGDEGNRQAVVALSSQLEQWIDHFSREHRPGQKIRGEDNIHRYRPLGTVVVRVTRTDSLFETMTRITAGVITGNRVIVSSDLGVSLVSDLLAAVPALKRLGVDEWRLQSDEEFVAYIAATRPACVRYAGPERVPAEVFRAAAKCGRIHISCRPVLRTARLELLQYLQEQTVSNQYHRYGGNLRDEDNDK